MSGSKISNVRSVRSVFNGTGEFIGASLHYNGGLDNDFVSAEDIVRALGLSQGGVAKIEGGHPGFMAILKEIAEMHQRKAADYGTNEDCFANVRASEKLGIEPWVAAVLRGMDKVQRIQTFIKKGSLKNESIEDSLLDLAAYCIIALSLRREAYDEACEKRAL